MKKKPIMYAYIKGSKYNKYSVTLEETEEFKPIQQDFDTLGDMLEWLIVFSNFNSIPIQFYK